LTWRHAASALLVGGLFLLSNLRFFAYAPSGVAVADFVLRHVIVGCVMVLAISAANRLVDHGAARLPTYAAAVAIVAALSDPISFFLSELLHWALGSAPSGARPVWPPTGVVGILIKGGLGTAAYVWWREARMTYEALRRSQLQRAHDARRLQETRLQTLQARVDPQFLFDALKQVATLQRSDPDAADVLLNELITLLRALMPHERADASTIVREFAIVASYLRIAAGLIGALTVEISVSDDTGEARLPPMLLIPLLMALLAASLAARSGAAFHLHLRADGSPDRIRIHLNLSTAVDPSFLASREMTRLRTQLHDLYGDTAAFSVQMEVRSTRCSNCHASLLGAPMRARDRRGGARMAVSSGTHGADSVVRPPDTGIHRLRMASQRGSA
jgi:hypothetical protein